jgi:hypothetical protein
VIEQGLATLNEKQRKTLELVATTAIVVLTREILHGGGYERELGGW